MSQSVCLYKKTQKKSNSFSQTFYCTESKYGIVVLLDLIVIFCHQLVSVSSLPSLENHKILVCVNLLEVKVCFYIYLQFNIA